MKKSTICFLFAILVLTNLTGQNQAPNWILNQPIQGGNHEYEAIEYIKLMPGFSYTPSAPADKFGARINPFILTPPQAGVTGGPEGMGDIVGEGGIVGVTSGSFAVSETGQATYVIPLEFPGGIGGMTPDLSLVYNSNGGDGILGPGWSLAGLSVISLAPPTRYHNGIRDAAKGLDYLENNYMLDGQRLILIDENHLTGWREYRTEVDEFKKIERHGFSTYPNPKDGEGMYFKVQTKSGLTYYYGTNLESRQGFYGGSTQAPTLYTVNYYVDKITDKYGNSITFGYDNIIETGEFYLERIDYTFTTESTGTDPAIYTIEFEYRERNSPVVTNYLYTPSSTDLPVSFSSNRLINSIACKYNETNTIVKTYELEYEPRGPISNLGPDYRNLHLKSIQEVGVTGEKYNKTAFEWEEEMDYLNLEVKTLNLPPIIFQPYYNMWGLHIRRIRHLEHIFIDVDNNGLNDLIRIYEVIERDWTGYSDAKQIYNHYFTIEVLKQSPYTTEFEIHEHHTFTNYPSYELFWDEEGWLPSLSMFRIADFNGNGYVDISLTKYDLNNYNHGQNNKHYTHSHLYLFENNNGSWDGQFSSYQQSVKSKNGFWVPLTGDFNGDGIGDLLFKRENQNPNDNYGQLVFLLGDQQEPLNSSIDSSDATALNYTTSLQLTNPIGLVDINGDGRSEIIEMIGDQKKIYRLDFVNNELAIDNFTTVNNVNKFNFLNLNSDKKLDYVNNFNLNISPINDYEFDVVLSFDFYHGGGANSKFINKGSLSFNINNFNEQGAADELVNTYTWIDNIVTSDITSSGQNEILISYIVQIEYVIDDDSSPFPGEPFYYYHTFLHTVTLIPNKAGDNFTVISANDPSLYQVVNDFQIVNVYGNHQPDFFKINAAESDSPTITIYSPTQQGTAISRIINGLGNEILIDYSFSSDPEVYTSNFSGDNNYPVMPFRHPLKLVKNVKRSNGTGGYFEEAYHYENALVHAEGKGFLGFEKTIRTNVNQGMKQITEYGVETNDNLYYVFPKKITSKLIDDRKISETVHSFSHFFPNTTSNGETTHNHFIFESSRTTTTWGLEGEIIRAERVSNEEFDNFGNLKRTRTRIAPNPAFLHHQTFETVTTQKYHNFEDKWILGRLSEAKVIMRSPGQPEITRESAFTYFNEGIHAGMLRFEIVEPNIPKFRTVKTYSYDNFGNIERTVLSGIDFETQINQSAYNTDPNNVAGRFLTEMRTIGIEGVDLIIKREYDPLLGNLSRVIDPNNLETKFEYNGFGQLQKEIMHDGNQSQTALRWVQPDDEEAPQHAVFYSWSATSGAAPVKVYFSNRGKELRRVTVGFDGSPVYVDTQYDNKGRIHKKSDPYFKNTTPLYTVYAEYDALNRPVRVVHPDNSETSFAYNGLTSSTTNALGHTNLKTVNAAGWLVRSEDADGNAVIQTHRSDGLVLSREVEGHPGTRREYEHNLLGNLESYSDLSQGTLTYTYNALGQLTESRNAHQQVTTYEYDQLSRLVRKNLPEGAIVWDFHNEVGKLGLVKSIENIDHTVLFNSYDEMGRPLQVTETISGEQEDFTKFFSYDIFGRIKTYTYPVTGFTIENIYNDLGYHEKVINSQNQQPLWEANTSNARGQFTDMRYGNSINQSIAYHHSTGRLHRILAGSVQDEEYQWDETGNLVYRKSRNGRSEMFLYDNLNRLTNRIHVDYGEDIAYVDTVLYNLLGNIIYKSGVGHYAYNETNPYQLDFINNMPAHIDPNTHIVHYSSFNKVVKMEQYLPGSIGVNPYAELDIVYGVDNQRIKQTIQRRSGQDVTRKIYIGGDFEKHVENGETKYVHYIHSPFGLIAILEQDSEGNQELNYVLKDHLGSIQVLLKEDGTVLQEYSYDPWGMRRCPQTWQLYYDIGDYLTDRGFTGHEHMDLFMLVNMNGRIYDPLVGRFLSPDPVLQFPDYTQGLNPYAYALNNPLRYVDPDGYSLVGNLMALSIQIALTAAGLPVLGLAAYSLIMTIDQYIESRGQISFIHTFTKNFVLSGASMVVTGNIGAGFDKLGKGKTMVELNRALAHGSFNGAMRMAQGGRFEHGFMSGFVSSLGGSYLQSQAPNMSAGMQVAMAGAIGGTAEALGGGKFANGAVTGAWVMMFNHMGGGGKDPEPEFERPTTPTAEADATRVELQQRLINDVRRVSNNSSGLGVGDALGVAGDVMFPENKYIKRINLGFTLYKVGNQVYNGQYLEAAWTGVEYAGGYYTLGFKVIQAHSQTRYFQTGIGRMYFQDYRFNLHQYQVTGRSFYMQRALFYERMMMNSNNNINNR